jgi:hypothetical protein
LRLWDALDQSLVVPFQYFGVHDGTQLSTMLRASSPSIRQITCARTPYCARYIRRSVLLTRCGHWDSVFRSSTRNLWPRSSTAKGCRR